MPRLPFLLGLVVLVFTGLIFIAPANGQTPTNRFAFGDFLLSPVRVHLLSAKDSPAIQTTLTEKDITRILQKVNGVWSQAGLHFYLESLVREEAQGQKLYTPTAEGTYQLALLGLRPTESRATNLFHIYYLKEMPNNGIYFPAAIFVKDTASLRKVEGGIDEPLPRVTSHELGHAFSLSHRQDNTNLMASGTTGTRLNEEEISQAREAARKFNWIQAAPDLMEKADALFRAGNVTNAAILYSRLATIPLSADQVKLAKKRIAQATRTDSNSTVK